MTALLPSSEACLEDKWDGVLLNASYYSEQPLQIIKAVGATDCLQCLFGSRCGRRFALSLQENWRDQPGLGVAGPLRRGVLAPAVLGLNSSPAEGIFLLLFTPLPSQVCVMGAPVLTEQGGPGSVNLQETPVQSPAFM